MDLLQYAFFQNALIGSLLTAIACGIVGTYIDVVFDPLCLWRGVGEQDAKRKGGFRYSGRMVAGYGFGSDLHLPYPGVRPESIRLSIW